jgi:streptogramin lyase
VNKMTQQRTQVLLAAFLCLLGLSMGARAAVLSGTVSSEEGHSLQGVLITATEAVSGRSESVYSDASGAYILETVLTGVLKLRARTPYYRDQHVDILLAADKPLQQQLVLQAMTDPVEISDSLPAAFHFGNLPFEKGDDANFSRLQFQRDCLSCHQLGNAFSRHQRTPESWAATIQRMHLYLGNFDMELRDERSVFLSRGFSGKPISVRPEFPLDSSLSNTKIYQYPLLQAGVPHDVIYNPDDGLLYTVDQRLDHMAVTDRATGKTDYVLQKGGKAMSFRQGISEDNPVFGEFNPGARHGPHSLAMGLDGKYYVTNTGTRSIGVFNPKTRQWEATHRMKAKTGAIYPHTIRVSKAGMVWFTLTGSEQVGRLDPTTGKFKVIKLPKHTPMGIAGTTQPYGIDIHPGDDATWYGRLFADKIGRIDPVTFEVTEYDSPVSGPRRMHFDKAGNLWVTGYSEGMLAKIDVKDFSSKVYSMPELAPGYRPAPYALGIHPETQDIWVNENMTDRIYRFIPAEERWVLYPIPLRGTYTRDMTFTREGHICTSNNPLPPAALEGGVLELICIDNDYKPMPLVKPSKLASVH